MVEASVPVIDSFCHWAPIRFANQLGRRLPRVPQMLTRALSMPVMTDISARLRLMDRFPGYRQVPSLVSPPLETLAGPKLATELARLANDSMAEEASRQPERFPGFFASLPLNNHEASLVEAERAIQHLDAVGVQLFTSINGRAPDSPFIMDLLAVIAKLDSTVLLHPTLQADKPDYVDEAHSRFELWWTLGWPYETSKAMYRLAFRGVFDRWPGLKIITHHAGGMIPMIEGRLGPGLSSYGSRTLGRIRDKEQMTTQRDVLRACKKFYTDTATFGSASAIDCAIRFFGPDRVLFGSDMPFGPEEGRGQIVLTAAALQELRLASHERQSILSGNSTRLLRLKSVDDTPSRVV